MAADADFDRVVSRTFEPVAVSPDVEGDLSFRGIRIDAPRRVALSGKPDRDRSFARVMLVGACHLDSNYLGMAERFLEHIHVVAVDAVLHRARCAPIELIPNAVPMRPEHYTISEVGLAGRSVLLYFNLNLVPLLHLPEAEAEYVIYAVLGRYVSNVVRTRVEP
jgi:hypothetical protein